MVTYLSTTITNLLISKDIIKQSDEKIYRYGVLTLIVNLISILDILVLGWITDTFIVSIIFMIGFALLRSFSGGFHCRHYIACNLTYASIYLICIYAYLNLPNNDMIINILCLFSLLNIFIMSPVIHIKKPLDEAKKKRNRVIAISIAICLYVLSFMSIELGVFKYVIISTALLQLFTRRGRDYVT